MKAKTWKCLGLGAALVMTTGQAAMAQSGVPGTGTPGQFDWVGFLSVALPVLFTTGTTVAGVLFGQKSERKANATSIDHASSALAIAAQALTAAAQIAQAAQSAQDRSGPAQSAQDTSPYPFHRP